MRRNFLAALLVLASVMSLVHSYEWKLVENQFTLPPFTFSLSHPKTAHFCRVQTAGGGVRVGTIPLGRLECLYGTDNDKVYVEKKVFEVLTLAPDETVEWQWLSPPSLPPPNAIPCEPRTSRDQLASPGCFLGHSLYTDGLCAEALGVVRVDPRSATYPIRMALDSNREVDSCAFSVLAVVRRAERAQEFF